MTPPRAMLERAARALARDHFNMCGNDDEHEEEVVSRRWPMFVPQARAVLEAIREPDDETLVPGCAIPGVSLDSGRRMWRRMIDSILQQE